MLPFPAFSPTALICSDVSALNTQLPVLDVIRSKCPNSLPDELEEVLSLKKVCCAYRPFTATYALVGP